MKGADEAIKVSGDTDVHASVGHLKADNPHFCYTLPTLFAQMISHESPSLLSRLCTVLVADLTMRAGRNAVSQQRRIINNQDFLDVTVGQGEGAGAEWEFLRDVVETAPTED